MSLSVYSLLNYPQVTKYTNYYNQEKYIFSKVVSLQFMPFKIALNLLFYKLLLPLVAFKHIEII